MAIKLIKEDDRGQNFQADDFKILYRHKGKYAGDNNINKHESIYFITGSARITIEDKTWEIKSPAKIEIPKETYHKIDALTDISFVLFEK